MAHRRVLGPKSFALLGQWCPYDHPQTVRLADALSRPDEMSTTWMTLDGRCTTNTGPAAGVVPDPDVVLVVDGCWIGSGSRSRRRASRHAFTIRRSNWATQARA